MNFAEYQAWAITKKAGDLTEREARLTWALGLVDEVIEVCETFFFGAEDPLEELEELGDVTWYAAVLAEAYQIYDLSVTYGYCQESGLLGLAMMLSASKQAGELVKKHVSHGHPMPQEALYQNLSFLISLVRNLALQRGNSLGEVMEMNRDKLDGRYEGGFSSEASRERTTTD